MDRAKALIEWVTAVAARAPVEVRVASSDASFRRYFRVEFADSTTRIVMDAPPEREDCRPFVAIARIFAAAGLNVPGVIASDLERGFLLLSDLGEKTYLDVLDARNAEALYSDATSALLKLQAASRPGVLPDYGRAILAREMRLFPHWYVEVHLKRRLTAEQVAGLETVFVRILDANLAQPCVFVHRDYHSRNLMATEPNPGVLDFQDALYGPISYDLVSLLKDAYVEWPEEQTLDWLIRYWERAKRAGLPVPHDFAQFHRDYEWMGAQRHLKVLGIFARLFHRDAKSAYLADMPLVAKYLLATCRRYGELGALARLLDTIHSEDVES